MTYTVAHPAARAEIRLQRESAHRAILASQDRRAAEFNRIRETILDRLSDLAEMGHAASPGFVREVAQDAARVIRALAARQGDAA